MDGDLSHNIKYTLDSIIDIGSTGVYRIEYRVTDSAGHVEYLPVEVEVYDSTEERISVVLKDYMIYLPLHAEFEPNDYYVGSDIEGELSVDNGVDTGTPGIYYVDYTVKSTNSMGKSRLVVIVEEA